MVEKITKRNGEIEEFDFEKIKEAIRVASIQANIEKVRAEELGALVTNSLMEAFADKTNASSQEIRDFVLGELDTHEPSVAEAWRAYDVDRTAL
jgi:transcriptional regulator NrdR family protein